MIRRIAAVAFRSYFCLKDGVKPWARARRMRRKLCREEEWGRY
ncbi:MAG: hypothetical protein H6Q73_1171 [Firmicutes bacterium]|nr:hypothetical protein [Bacillota bacterium]